MGSCNLLLFGFHVLSVCRNSLRGFDAVDTISLMVWGGAGMVPSMKGWGWGSVDNRSYDGISLNMATCYLCEISLLNYRGEREGEAPLAFVSMS